MTTLPELEMQLCRPSAADAKLCPCSPVFSSYSPRLKGLFPYLMPSSALLHLYIQDVLRPQNPTVSVLQQPVTTYAHTMMFSAVIMIGLIIHGQQSKSHP